MGGPRSGCTAKDGCAASRRRSEAPAVLRQLPVLVLLVTAAAACGAPDAAPDSDALRLEVMETERAFARTMADRDFGAFTSFLSEEAVFFSDDEPLEGREQVEAAWAPLFQDPEAPFSWRPDVVVVLESGSLALSTGPVYGPDGTAVATFTSIWRREAPGTWRIVFDRGCPTCTVQ